MHEENGKLKWAHAKYFSLLHVNPTQKWNCIHQKTGSYILVVQMHSKFITVKRISFQTFYQTFKYL